MKADPVALPADSASRPNVAWRTSGRPWLLEASRYWGACGIAQGTRTTTIRDRYGAANGFYRSTACIEFASEHRLHARVDGLHLRVRDMRAACWAGGDTYLAFESRRQIDSSKKFYWEAAPVRSRSGFKAIWMHPGDRKERLAHWRCLQSIGSLQVVAVSARLSPSQLRGCAGFRGWIARGAPLSRSASIRITLSTFGRRRVA